MIEPIRLRWKLGVVSLLAAGVLPGCTMVPRSQFEESRRLTQTLRTENARLKDDLVVTQTQNRDYADRALDDLRRLTARDEAIERLERSVQEYQDDRDRLAASYRRLATSLGRTTQDSAVESTSARRESVPDQRGTLASVPREAGDPEVVLGKADGEDEPEPPAPPTRTSDP